MPDTDPSVTGPLNQGRLVKAVAAQTGRSERETEQIVTAVLDVILSAVTAGQSVTLENFGTFLSVVAPARAARNPRTGEPLRVPPTRSMRFRVSRKARRIVADGDPSVARRSTRARQP